MKKEEFETEMSLWKSEFEQEMTEARETWDTEKAARDAQFKERMNNAKRSATGKRRPTSMILTANVSNNVTHWRMS